jgi:Do/DeqQ family serine protease
MKKILTLIFVSALGGALTLGSYKLFFEKKNSISATETQKKEQPFLIPIHYNTTDNKLVTTETPNLVEAAEKTIDAVVHVKNTAVISGINTYEDLFFGRKSQREQIGTGSGVIISPDGYIITNNHVIKGAKEISITLNNNKEFIAELIGTDPKTDIALLKIDTDEDLPYTIFGDSDEVKVGEWVLAVGNPFNLTSTVTAGIISAKSRNLSLNNSQSFLQTDAAVNPGNSGGALVNVNGELIGVNTAITSKTGSYIGYSFAVPSNIAKKVINDIMEFGSVQNVVLGIRGGEINDAFAKQEGLHETEGFYVDEVETGSGASKAGIQSGDIIKKLDEIEISKFSDLSGYLKTKQPNDVVNVTLLRGDEEKIIAVKLSKEASIVDFMNIEFRNLSSKMKELYKTDKGVFVTKSNNNRLYKATGLNSGYILTAINNKPINSLEDIKELQNTYGDSFEDSLISLELINRNGEKKQYIFSN